MPTTSLYPDEPYLAIASDLLYSSGRYYFDEKDGIGRYEAFGREMRFDVRTRLPLLTTKSVPYMKALHELRWFISGEQRIDYLRKHGVHIWDTWADEQGVVGPLYGSMWRDWKCAPGTAYAFGGDQSVDQLRAVIGSLRNRPMARSHVISAWRPDFLPFQSIKPCHVYLQFFVSVDGGLSLQITQRSCDWFLGVPFNIAQYAAFVHIMAHMTGHWPDTLIWYGNDVHIYENHVEQIETMFHREPVLPPQFAIRKDAPTDIDELDIERDVWVGNYAHNGRLKGDIVAQGTPGEGVELA